MLELVLHQSVTISDYSKGPGFKYQCTQCCQQLVDKKPLSLFLQCQSQGHRILFDVNSNFLHCNLVYSCVECRICGNQQFIALLVFTLCLKLLAFYGVFSWASRLLQPLKWPVSIFVHYQCGLFLLSGLVSFFFFYLPMICDGSYLSYFTAILLLTYMVLKPCTTTHDCCQWYILTIA